MRTEWIGRQALLDNGRHRLASLGSGRRRFNGDRQRRLGKILAHHAIAVVMLPRRTGMPRALMLMVFMRGRMIVMMMSMSMPVMMMAFRLNHCGRRMSPMIVQKPMPAPNDHRHQRIASGKQISQGGPQSLHNQTARKARVPSAIHPSSDAPTSPHPGNMSGRALAH